MARYYSIDSNKIDSDKDYREKIFYKFFPQKIGKTSTLDWLCSNCADSNNVVTPRDVIDFFKFAKAEQFKRFKLNPQDQEYLVTDEVFKIALEELSKHKKTTYLFAEFEHLKDYILKFESGHADYSASALQQLLGDKWQMSIEELRSIGFVKFIPKKAMYKIPVIWRKGLNIKRGKA